MPALSDDMYCSEQICIPPAFPYLLRQYAKAAIRTQPTDLLRWSTAYFRCLSLNIPPPVKPRLEYPIPRDYHGVTPGWLKALIYQLQNNLTIPYEVLRDRWTGACLKHTTLIKLLCLGGFDNPEAVPWLQLVALCAATLTDDLTRTMILICEIITEEPEGGSAMITLETFLDLYKFLAKIDASTDQMLRNYYFRDLFIYAQRPGKLVGKDVLDEVIEKSEESVLSKPSSETLIEADKDKDVEKIVSCPSLPEDDHYSYEHLLEAQEGELEEKQESEKSVGKFVGETEEQEAEEEEEEEEEGKDEEAEKDEDEHDLKKRSVEASESKEEQEALEDEGRPDENENVLEDGEEKESDTKPEENVETEENVVEQTDTKEEGESKKEEEAEKTEEERAVEPKEYESVESIVDQPVRDLDLVFEDDKLLQEDLARLKALQEELAGETDDEIEKFKCKLIEEMPLTDSQEIGVKHFKGDMKGAASSSREGIKSLTEDLRSEEATLSSKDSKESGDSQKSKEKEEDKPYDDVFMEAIPGIGGVVPDELIQAVEAYMRKCAKSQHGMVMPRNIRHFECPPLEVMDY